MSLDTVAIIALGAFIGARVFVTLVDWHYQSELQLRRALNDAWEQAMARRRAAEAAARES